MEKYTIHPEQLDDLIYRTLLKIKRTYNIISKRTRAKHVHDDLYVVHVKMTKSTLLDQSLAILTLLNTLRPYINDDLTETEGLTSFTFKLHTTLHEGMHDHHKHELVMNMHMYN